MAHSPTRALGIPYVGNKWAHMNMFSAALPAGDPKKYSYLDLTFGCGVCSIFMYEIGCKTFISNDASPYPRLIAEAFLGEKAKQYTSAELMGRIQSAGYTRGWAFENTLKTAIRHRTACSIDALCADNQDHPLILVAIGAVLSQGAMADFRYGFTKHLTPEVFKDLVFKKAMRLNHRVGNACNTKITNVNYLNIEDDFGDLENFVCYLDPAWPAQPEKGRKHSSNERVYGFYAKTLMSILRQRGMPMPEEYDVTLEGCYEGMRKTIDILREKNTVMIAYQSRPDVVGEVTAELFDGLNYKEYAEQRKSGTKLWEYLWRVL